MVVCREAEEQQEEEEEEAEAVERYGGFCRTAAGEEAEKKAGEDNGGGGGGERDGTAVGSPVVVGSLLACSTAPTPTVVCGNGEVVLVVVIGGVGEG